MVLATELPAIGWELNGGKMNKKSTMSGVFSTQTRNNILLDMTLLFSGLAAAISGIYFLFLPVGGYQGGRNPLYGVTILFDRHSWSDIHTWASVIMIALVALHVPIHWDWIVKMTRSGIKAVAGKSSLNSRSRLNLGINILIGLSGLICGLSGIYFLFNPGALHASLGESWLFAPAVWDVIHTWSGVVMISAVILHFGIHWKWVVKVVGKYWKALTGQQVGPRAEAKNPLPAPQLES
jgi:hypothetical protein